MNVYNLAKVNLFLVFTNQGGLVSKQFTFHKKPVMSITKGARRFFLLSLVNVHGKQETVRTFIRPSH